MDSAGCTCIYISRYIHATNLIQIKEAIKLRVTVQEGLGEVVGRD